MADANSKACRVCGVVLPLDRFYRASGNTDGLQKTCKSCHCADTLARYRKKNPDLPSPIAQCAHCGKDFHRPVMNPPRGNVRHCSLECRFWSKVDKSGGSDSCWPWTAGQSRGYGVIGHDGKSLVASRVAYELTKGVIPSGMLACHTCDNPLCCNPDHIFVGEHQDNMDDRMAKGRYYVKSTKAERAEWSRRSATGRKKSPEAKEKMRLALENWRRSKTQVR